jgi:formylglycine-generating enzyme required for sulfatase activity
MAARPLDPADVEAILRENAELKAQLAAAREQASVADGQAGLPGAGSGAATPTIATHGGAFVHGAVRVRNGHFIGRDLVQVFNTIVKKGEDVEEAKSVIALYVQAFAVDLSGLKLGEIDSSVDQTHQTPLQLADIYVPLDTTQRIPRDLTLAQWRERDSASQPDEVSDVRETRAVTALEALAHHRQLTVLGKPGSGKSTFGSHVLLMLARAWQGQVEALERLGPGWTYGTLLPIRVVLRRFAEWLPAGKAPARAGQLWKFIGLELKATGYGLSNDTMKFVQRIARDHGALVLFDGLDECGTKDRRARVLSAVEELMRSAGEKCRFVLTARPYAWPRGPDPALGAYALDDLNPEQSEQFIRGWYRAVVNKGWRSPGDAERKADDLVRVRERSDLQPLVQNPLLLTLMAVLHTNRGWLPDDRADLYNESVELLMLRWNQKIGADKALLDELGIPGLKLSNLREVLEKLAFDVHKQDVSETTADIREGRLVSAFEKLLHSKDKAGVVVEYIERRAGLLIGQGEREGERQFAFPHRTFREFLAACHLAAHQEFAKECRLLVESASAAAHWQVVLPLAARLAKAERGVSAADELIYGRSIEEHRARQTPNEDDWTRAFLAGTQLLEIGLNALTSDRTQAIAARVTGWLAASLAVHPDEGGTRAALRARAGDVLARLGDPRFDSRRFHLPADDMAGFVHIPADPAFRIGTRAKDAERIGTAVGAHVSPYEINDVITPTPEFHIARYPVTVAQFAAFYNATNHPIDPDALRDPDNQPVHWVSWHDAVAFCDWMNGLLARSPELEATAIAALVRDGGWFVTLPSELEWEKAARGGRDAVFPWGDEPDATRANVTDAGINAPCSVGCFPPNRFGLFDMSGNVWGWTRSLWGTDFGRPSFAYPYDPSDQRRENLTADDSVLRVVRGGSWLSPREWARCACRDRFQPHRRNDYVGFRVMLRGGGSGAR